jgi:SAM-dependent methyltransferase
MDDKNFDQNTAQDWISSVEAANTTRTKDIFPKLNAWINQISPSKILDIGCGQGICSDYIDLHDRYYTGIEPSSFMVDRAKELYSQKNRTFLLGNAYNLPFCDGAFDAVFSVLVWHLLSVIKKAAAELSRVLKPNGSFLIMTANPSGYEAWKALYTELKIDGPKLEGKMQLSDSLTSHDILYLHTFEEIENSLQDMHLEIQSTEQFRKSALGQEFLMSIQGRKII